MSVPDSLATALTVAVILGLVKAIDWLLSRKRENFSKTQENKLEDILDTSKKLTNAIERVIEGGALTREQRDLIEEIYKMTEHLNALHSVYDNNHVPKWYVPSDLIDRLVKINSRLEMLSERQTNNLDEIKESQTILIQKISDLILSQNHMTDRLGDLLNVLGKNNR